MRLALFASYPSCDRWVASMNHPMLWCIAYTVGELRSLVYCIKLSSRVDYLIIYEGTEWKSSRVNGSRFMWLQIIILRPRDPKLQILFYFSIIFLLFLLPPSSPWQETWGHKNNSTQHNCSNFSLHPPCQLLAFSLSQRLVERNASPPWPWLWLGCKWRGRDGGPGMEKTTSLLEARVACSWVLEVSVPSDRSTKVELKECI